MEENFQKNSYGLEKINEFVPNEKKNKVFNYFQTLNFFDNFSALLLWKINVLHTKLKFSLQV